MSLLDIAAKIKAEGIVKAESPKQIKQDLSEYEDFMSVRPVLSSEPVKKTKKTVAKTTAKPKSKTTPKKTVSKPVEVKPIKKVKLFGAVPYTKDGTLEQKLSEYWRDDGTPRRVNI